MKKILITFLLSIIFINLSYAQNFGWAKAVGGSDVDGGSSIVADASGNTYTAGYFTGTVDFDPGSTTFNMTSVGTWDVFIQKLDPAGDFLWAKSIKGDGYHENIILDIDASGNVYTTGTFFNTVDFDPGINTFNLTAIDGSDVFIQKLDASGNFIWAKSFGGTSYDEPYSINIDKTGNIYTVGTFHGTVDFDPGSATYNVTSSAYYGVFLQKLNAAGNFVWVKDWGGASPIIISSVTTGFSGNVYMTGYFGNAPQDFDPNGGMYNLTCEGNYDAFILKLNASGSFIWAKSIGGESTTIGGTYYDSYTKGYSITTDTYDNVYTTGYFTGQLVDFNTGSGTSNIAADHKDIYVHKLDSLGNFIWAKTMGGAEYEIGKSITTDAMGNAYITGSYSGTADFDPGSTTHNLTAKGALDIFIQKLDTLGNFVWVKSIGSFVNDDALSITLDNAGNIYTTGYFNFSADFNPGSGTYSLTSAGQSDAFIVKLTKNGTGINTLSNKNIKMKIYPNPNRGSFNMEISSKDNKSKQYKLEIYSMLGVLVHSETIQVASVTYKQMHFENLNTGVYFIHLKGESDVLNGRFIVE